MKKNRDSRADSMRKMTDAELSKRLGHYQVRESVGMLLGILCIIAGCILAFVKRDVVLLAILFFGGVALILLLALPAQKKKKALMQQQLGGFFRAELDKTFGPEPEKPVLPISEEFLKNAGLTAISWTECSVADFHEGVHKGLHFSAANVELRRTVEERSGPQNDNWMTRTETLFRGVVLRCRDICDPALDIVVNDQFQKRTGGDMTDPAVFERYFTVHTADGRPADSAAMPQLRELVQKLEAYANNGRVCGLSLSGGALALALETRYVFAGVPEELDLRDIDGIRKWFIASLSSMGKLLDILAESLSPAVTGAKE